MRIGVTGASGMLGSVLIAHFSTLYKVFATSRTKGVEGKGIEWDCFDLTDDKLLRNWLNIIKPDVVIHCAAIINVDFCENNVDLVEKLHVETTKIISKYLDNNNGRLIFISTDSVFNGEKKGAYSEADVVNPLNVYAATKVMGENVVQSMTGGLVLRTNIIGVAKEGEVSFAQWVLKNLIAKEPIGLFHDVYFSPLNVHDLTKIIGKIIINPIVGLYHCASKNSISKYDFGKAMAEIYQLSSLSINKISVNEMEFKASRPKNMALNINKINDDLQYSFPSAIDAIKIMKIQCK